MVNVKSICHLQFGTTALMHAAWAGRDDCVRVLVELGASMEARNNVRSLLILESICLIIIMESLMH